MNQPKKGRRKKPTRDARRNAVQAKGPRKGGPVGENRLKHCMTWQPRWRAGREPTDHLSAGARGMDDDLKPVGSQTDPRRTHLQAAVNADRVPLGDAVSPTRPPRRRRVRQRSVRTRRRSRAEASSNDPNRQLPSPPKTRRARASWPARRRRPPRAGAVAAGRYMEGINWLLQPMGQPHLYSVKTKVLALPKKFDAIRLMGRRPRLCSTTRWSTDHDLLAKAPPATMDAKR